MRLFGTTDAAHFCAGYRSISSVAGRRPYDLGFSRGTRREGTPDFDAVRAALLDDSERNLFFAASHYRRSLDLMLVSSAAWAQVTLYYGAWYAAQALLGMFGGAVLRGDDVVEVARSTPGSQAIRVAKEVSTYTGPHQRFWDLFYSAVAPLRPRVSAAHAVALTAVSSSTIWQIRNRNAVNYDTAASLALSGRFARSFDKDTFPACLPGTLGTQYRITEGLVEVAFTFASELGLRTAVLGGVLSGCSDVRDCVNQLVYVDRAPRLVRKTRKATLV